MAAYTDEELLKARALARELDLEGWDLFCLPPLEQLSSMVNGIGAAWQPEAVRKILDRRFTDLRVAAMIHDVMYTYGTGTDEDFKSANAALESNGRKLADHYHPWWSPSRYLCRRDARLLAKACDLFGRKAYDEAVAARSSREG